MGSESDGVTFLLGDGTWLRHFDKVLKSCQDLIDRRYEINRPGVGGRVLTSRGISQHSSF